MQICLFIQHCIGAAPLGAPVPLRGMSQVDDPRLSTEEKLERAAAADNTSSALERLLQTAQNKLLHAESEEEEEDNTSPPSDPQSPDADDTAEVVKFLKERGEQELHNTTSISKPVMPASSKCGSSPWRRPSGVPNLPKPPPGPPPGHILAPPPPTQELPIPVPPLGPPPGPIAAPLHAPPGPAVQAQQPWFGHDQWQGGTWTDPDEKQPDKGTWSGGTWSDHDKWKSGTWTDDGVVQGPCGANFHRYTAYNEDHGKGRKGKVFVHPEIEGDRRKGDGYWRVHAQRYGKRSGKHWGWYSITQALSKPWLAAALVKFHQDYPSHEKPHSDLNDEDEVKSHIEHYKAIVTGK